MGTIARKNGKRVNSLCIFRRALRLSDIDLPRDAYDVIKILTMSAFKRLRFDYSYYSHIYLSFPPVVSPLLDFI